MLTKTVLNKSEAIALYRSLGFALFPLAGKKPAMSGNWRLTCIEQFPELQGNFGVVLPPEILVIDIDPRNDGDITLLGIDLPKTFTVITGSGGAHLYYRKSPTIKIKKHVRDIPGIEFLSEGCYVVGAGSEHPDTGFEYTTEGDIILDAPAELLTLIRKQELVSQAPGSVDQAIDNPQNIARYTDFLLKADPALEGAAGDAHTFTIAATGRDYDLSLDTVLELMLEHFNPRCVPPWAESDLALKVQNAFKYATNVPGSKAVTAIAFPEIKKTDTDDTLFHRDQFGGLKKDVYNTALFFAPKMPLEHTLCFNEFSQNIEYLKPAPWHKPGQNVIIWEENEAVSYKHWLSSVFHGFEPPTKTVLEAGYIASRDRRYHPVKDYLNSLVWDGHLRAHNWLSEIMGAADNTYTRAVGMKFLVAAVKRIFEPGCKFDYILTFEGKQGTYKSTAFEILSVKKEWYCDPSLDLTNKDSIFMLFGKWIIELPEMATHFRAETTAMKSFLSRNTDRARMVYARTSTDFPRQCVFAGTINPDSDRDIGWLKDTTGNRRYWPVLIGEKKQPDLASLAKIVHQLWAEAYELYRKGVPIYLEDAKIAEEAASEQEKRLGTDPWLHVIYGWVNSAGMKDINIISGAEIYRDCLNGSVSHLAVKEEGRISRIMKKLGWDKGSFWVTEIKNNKRGYRRPKVEEDEIE